MFQIVVFLTKILALFVNVINALKCDWNKFVDKTHNKIKFKSSKLCVAKNFNVITQTYNIPCDIYTYDRYCNSHAKAERKAHREYHHTDGHDLFDPETVPLIKKELDDRFVYNERFF